MSKLLFVTSSVFGDNSKSRQIALEFIAAWRTAHPATSLATRDLNAGPMPHISLDTLGALMTPAEGRTREQQASVDFSDRLIEELEAADTIVIAAPMYNFSIPSTLKAWIDHVARAGRTFRYTAAGTPEGLLRNKRVFVVTGRGGFYAGESPARALDFQEPYLRAVLGFLGLDDVSFIHVEGLKVSPEAAANGLDRARASIGALLPAAMAA
jgi:FMN-dependent NADH-azoreductase